MDPAFDTEKPLQTLHQYHRELAQEQPRDILHYQFGNHVVSPVVYADEEEEYVNRYVVESTVNGIHSTILEECRVVDGKPVEEKKEIDEVGQEVIRTNDIEKLREEDMTFEQIFQLLKQQYPFLTNEHVISVRKIPSSGSIEYAIEVDEPTGQQTETLVLYDQEKNQPNILETRPIPVRRPLPSTPEEPRFTIMPADQLRPEVKTVVDEVQHQVEVKYPNDPLVVEKPLVQEGENGIVKIIQNVQNPTKHKTVTVTEIINPTTGVHVTEDIK